MVRDMGTLQHAVHVRAVPFPTMKGARSTDHSG